MDGRFTAEQKQALIAYLRQFVTRNKWRRMQQVLPQRTRYVTVVLEDISHPHNASAVVRSCECFGVQDVHVVEREHDFRPAKGIAMGSAKWLTLHRYEDDAGRRGLQACVDTLRAQGYQLVATTLRADSIPIGELELNQKLAFCYGTERDGLSTTAHEIADVFVRIPMVGFTQSFNVSVTVALMLYEVSGRLRETAVPWQLSHTEKTDLLLEWLASSIPHAEQIITQFCRDSGWQG